MSFEKNTIVKPTDGQLKNWLKVHGKENVHHFVSKDGKKQCWLQTPGRLDIDMARSERDKENRSSSFDSIIIKNCWLAGDKEMHDDDKYFYGLGRAIAEILPFAEVELKKNSSDTE